MGGNSHIWRAALAAGLALTVAAAQAQTALTGVVRDFEELRHKQATGGHPDFNPTWNPKGWEGWGCFDNMTAGKGAVQAALVSAPENPDNLAGFIPADRDGFGPALKPGYDAPPNCFRSRFAE